MEIKDYDFNKRLGVDMSTAKIINAKEAKLQTPQKSFNLG